MAGIRSGLKPAAAGGILAVAFVASVGVSAAASMAMSSSPDVTATTTQTKPTEPGSEEADTTSDSTSSTGQDDATEREVKQVSDAPKKATKSQVKQSKNALCKANPSKLPRIAFDSGSVQWIKSLEVLAFDRGFEPGPIDGIYTVQTRNAIRSFEDAFGMNVDGNMQLPDWQALWDDLCAPDPVYVAPVPAYTPPSGGGGGGGSGDGGGGLSRLD